MKAQIHIQNKKVEWYGILCLHC